MHQKPTSFLQQIRFSNQVILAFFFFFLLIGRANGSNEFDSNHYVANCGFMFDLIQDDVSCIGENDGSIQANVTSGTGPFSFQWTGPGNFSSTAQNLNNLGAGVYSVTITDGNGCSEIGMVTVATDPDTLAPLLIGVPADDTMDCGDNIPVDPVTVSDNCPGVQMFTTNSVSSIECSPGLAAWWPAEGNANDAQGSLNASLINGTTFSSGIAGDAFSFDGLNDYIEVNDTVRFAANNYSVGLWINTADTTRNQTIFSATDPLNGLPGVQVSLDSNGSVNFLHRFPFGSSGGTTISSANGFNDGNWHQVVAVKRDTVMRLFVDNVLVGTAIDYTTIDEPVRITLGRLSYLTLSDNEYFNGRIDENRVYSRALCNAEIQALYLAGIQNNTWAPTFRLTRTWTALDAAGNFTSASQEIYFLDQTAPDLTVPEPITLYCNGEGGVPVSDSQIRAWLNSAIASDHCTCVVLTYTAPPLFPAGCDSSVSTTYVTFSATDECGNLSMATSSITVLDTTGPEMTCNDITVQVDESNCEAAVQYDVLSIDACSGDTLPVTYDIEPGSMFASGATMVTATSTDACGNASTCSFEM